MQGKLYLCATPIGNLDDITFRVLNTLKEVDLIAAEDTRHSIKLLNHFDIKTPMTSYHEFNKIDKAKYLVEKMLEGVNIALVTDAGTPGISDPGEELVRQCYEAGIEVTSLPGPAACFILLISVDIVNLVCINARLLINDDRCLHFQPGSAAFHRFDQNHICFFILDWMDHTHTLRFHLILLHGSNDLDQTMGPVYHVHPSARL